MKVRIEVDCDNAAFEGNSLMPELCHVLEQAVIKIEAQRQRPPSACTSPESVDKLLDTNGNTCGSIEVTK